jgi:ferredoxin
MCKLTMPNIHVVNTGQDVETDLVTSILVALQRNAVPILSICGGRAQCGKCAVRVVSGGEFLTKISALESIRLKAMQADADVRLACQTHTRGDVEIEVLNLLEPAPD